MTSLPFSAVPGSSALFLSYITDWPSVGQFYASPPTLGSIKARARQLSNGHVDRSALCDALEAQQVRFDSDPGSVRKLRSGAVAVITGQQSGLFTGPMYTLLKALTILDLCQTLESRGVPAVPVFWIASEDHDHEEIRSATVLKTDSAIARIEVRLDNPGSSPVGWLELGGDIEPAVDHCINALPESEFRREVRDLLRETHRPGVSPVDAFGRMMARLFRGSGLVLADPLDPALKTLAKPTLDELLKRCDDIRQRLLDRNLELIQRGFHAQVFVDQDFTGLFEYQKRSRVALKAGTRNGGGTLSPNALFRPVVQDALFPTAAYVGGPAEIAYFAQASVVYEALGLTAPPVFPRISATLIEARVSRAMAKYGIVAEEAFQGTDRLARRAVGSEVGLSVFDEAHGTIQREIERLRKVVRDCDPTLDGAAENALHKVLYQVESLRTRFINAEVRRNEIMERQLRLIANSIYPERKLQERVLNVCSFLARFGLGFPDLLRRRITLETSVHQLVEF